MEAQAWVCPAFANKGNSPALENTMALEVLTKIHSVTCGSPALPAVGSLPGGRRDSSLCPPPVASQPSPPSTSLPWAGQPSAGRAPGMEGPHFSWDTSCPLSHPCPSPCLLAATSHVSSPDRGSQGQQVPRVAMCCLFSSLNILPHRSEVVYLYLIIDLHIYHPNIFILPAVGSFPSLLIDPWRYP